MGTDPARAYTEKHVGIVCVVISQVYYTLQIKKYVCTSQSNPSEENAKLHHPAVAADRTFDSPVNRNGRHRKKEKKSYDT